MSITLPTTLIGTVLGRGLLEDRPAAAEANTGWLWYATDEEHWYQSDGADWLENTLDPASAGADPAGYADGLISTHEGAEDPHPQYLTSDEGAAAYDAIGAASTAETNAKDYADLTFVPLASVGLADGVASLDAAGKVPNAQLPALAITETWVVANEAAMLALTDAETGDVAVRSDQSKSYILAGDDPTTLGDWQELLTPPNAVISVDGSVGAVDLSTTYAPISHTSETTSVHGISDTDDLVYTSDSRLSDSRTPTSHAASHNAGGGDALAIDAAAGTGSLRTLGTTSTSAAAGNHTHTATVGLDIVVGDGSAVLTNGTKARIEVPIAATITGVRLVADQAGAVTVTIKKSAGFAGLPTTTSIVAAAAPTLSAAQTYQDTTLTGWTTSVSAGDWLEFVLSGAGTITALTISLTMTRSV